MSAPAAVSRPLAREVAEVLSQLNGRHAEIVAVTSRPNPWTTLFPSEIITVELADGERLQLLCKHLGDEESDHPDKQVRGREQLTYERLLAGAGARLPVPAYHGARWDVGTQRRTVYLEWVAGWPLSKHAFDVWPDAARALAELHAHFTDDARTRHAGFLLQLDSDYFGERFELACASVSLVSHELARRLETLRPSCRRLAELLEEQPSTLVHNDLSPKNVVVQAAPDGVRIVLIDWEQAGAGAGLLDLAHLTHGVDDETERRMLASYVEVAAPAGVVSQDPAERDTVLTAARAHKAVYRLWRSPKWNPGRRTLARWIAEIAKLVARA